MRNTFLPHKVGIFVWRLKLGRLPVRVELDKRGIELDSVLCPNCKSVTESIEHMILNCQKVKEVWVKIFKWCNMGDISYSGSVDMFNGNGSLSNQIISKVWQAIEWVTGYVIWNRRNAKTFENKEWNVPTVVNEIQSMSFLWISTRCKSVNFDWAQWLLNPLTFDAQG
ncbi:uncharacterized protein [Rutidosis leptorrhynchoides]|uniref:uncharacterized protein n=1 Tax=Rutidosis leptorrhynchoides TaxID=125765 RepID=UPI003A9A0C63